MVGQFEQAILALMIFVIMLGMGASLTPRDFVLALKLKRPYGLMIGVVSQYGFMPFIGFLLALTLPVSDPIKIGILIMSCMPGGTTSNIFTYFSKGNLALSVLMTVTSTVFGVVLIPIVLVVYAGALDVDIPRENIIATLLLVPVAIGMVMRKLNANVGAVTEFMGSMLAIFFIVFLIVSWIPRNFTFLLETSWGTYVAAIALGLIGITVGYLFAKALKLHPRNARTVGLETGIQNGPLAIAIIAFTFSGAEQQAVNAVPVLYSLFIVIVSTLITLYFRRANTAAEQKMPDGLL